MNSYLRAMSNLERMGYPHMKAVGVTNTASSYMRALEFAPQYLEGIAADLSATVQYIQQYKIDNVQVGEPQVIAVTGMPGTGKSTYLEMMRDEGAAIVDEFWSQDDDYEQKKELLERLIRNDKKVYIAACQIEYPIIHRIHFVCSAEQRLENLSNRQRDATDLLRIKHFDTFNMYDNVVFEGERVNAHIIKSHKF